MSLVSVNLSYFINIIIDHRSLTGKQPLHMQTRIPKIFTFTTTLVTSIWFLSLVRNVSIMDLSQYDVLLSTLENCGEFEARSFSNHARVGYSESIPATLASMLMFVDHTFVLSIKGCGSHIPPSLERRATCIIGSELDRCTPASFVQGKFGHAMKVTFTHAVVMLLSRRAGYKHVAVIEDDITFVDRKLSRESVNDFVHLLQTDFWSFIRFGYRPYFLQDGGGAKHCPMKCRCEMNASMGDHLCKLRTSGCDLRSSDFYIVHSRHFADFTARMLDLSAQNSKRIVDLHPMRAFSDQWLFLPQVSYQATLDIPADYQLGAGSLYIKKCAGPRPLPNSVTEQLSSKFRNETLSGR